MDAAYRIENAAELLTPTVVVYPQLVQANLQQVLLRAGRPDKLRPHAKTHKTAELTRMELQAGIAKHKCATLAEGQVLAEAGVRDVLIAYPIVGPNISRLAKLAKKFPEVQWHALVDHPSPLSTMKREFAGLSQPISLLVDLDVGMGRTGIAIGDAALELYRAISSPASRGVVAGGLHVYDGHIKQASLDERRVAVRAIWKTVSDFMVRLEAAGMQVPRVVCGGTPTFPCWSELADEDVRIECSPGTFFLNDASYVATYADMPFPPAALVVGRVISKPRVGQMTCDLGSKAVAADPPLERRVQLLNVPGGKILAQNEEHLVIETPSADQFKIGDLVYGIPGHICPTCALHKELVAVESGRIVGTWAVRARDRVL